MRRAVHESFSPRAVERYQVIQAQSALQAALRTIANPDGWKLNIQLCVGTTVPYSMSGADC